MAQAWPNTFAIHDISAPDKPCKHCAYACHKKLNTSKKRQVTLNLCTIYVPTMYSTYRLAH